jgi:hypothetical protein
MKITNDEQARARRLALRESRRLGRPQFDDDLALLLIADGREHLVYAPENSRGWGAGCRRSEQPHRISLA